MSFRRSSTSSASASAAAEAEERRRKSASVTMGGPMLSISSSSVSLEKRSLEKKPSLEKSRSGNGRNSQSLLGDLPEGKSANTSQVPALTSAKSVPLARSSVEADRRKKSGPIGTTNPLLDERNRKKSSTGTSPSHSPKVSMSGEVGDGGTRRSSTTSYQPSTSSRAAEAEKARLRRSSTTANPVGTTASRRSSVTTVSIETKLFNACQNGDFHEADALIKEGADVNSVGMGGMTPLCIASGGGEVQIVRLLLSNGAQVDKADKDGCMTPLMMACAGGHAEIVKLLLNKGAFVDQAEQGEGFTVLMVAIGGHHLSIVQLLLDKGATVDQAIASGPMKGVTALMMAIMPDGKKGGDVGIVQMLLEKGATVDREAANGDTPLSLAMKNGDTDKHIVEMLLAKKKEQTEGVGLHGESRDHVSPAFLQSTQQA